jgi:hypothetical protein
LAWLDPDDGALDALIEYGTRMPATTVVNAQIKGDYTDSPNEAEIGRLIDHPIVYKHGLSHYLRIVLTHLFGRKRGSANIFDGVLITNYNVPIMFLKNTRVAQGVMLHVQIEAVKKAFDTVAKLTHESLQRKRAETKTNMLHGTCIALAIIGAVTLLY